MELIYNTTFSETELLFFKNTTVSFQNCKVIIKFPTFEDVIKTNESLIFFESLLNKKYWSNQSFIANSRLEYIYGMFHIFNSKENIIINAFQKFFPNLVYSDKKIKCDDYIINDIEFELLTDILLVSANSLTFKEYEEKYNALQEQKLSEEELEWKRKQQAAEEKIKKIKSNKKTTKNNIHSMCMCIISFFPQYQLKDLLALNYYAIYDLYKTAMIRQNDQIAVIAAGNGLLKEKYEPIF